MVSDIITPGETPPGSHGLTDVAGCISKLKCVHIPKDGNSSQKVFLLMFLLTI